MSHSPKRHVGRPQLAPALENVPEGLREWPHWVNWHAVPSERAGVIKYRKIPLNPKTGHNARTNDPATWGPFDDAVARCTAAGPGGFPERCAGIGVILGEHAGVNLVGMDFDGCVTDGVIDQDIAAIIAQLPGYAEFSPSGKGVKVFWFTTVDLSHLTRNGHDGKGRGREFYCGSPRYFTVTGRALDGRSETGDVIGPDWADMLDRPIEQLVADMMSDVEGRVGVAPPRLVADGGQVVDPDVDPDEAFLLGMSEKPNGWTLERVRAELLPHVSADCSYEDWFKVCCALHHHGDGAEDWFELFDGWSQSASDRYPGEDGPEGTRSKWESLGKRQKGTPMTLRTLIKMARTPGRRSAARSSASGGGLQLLTIPELFDRPAPSWLVRGVIPSVGLGVMYGEPGCGKSFCALSLALAICRGKEWHDRRTVRAGVIYVAAEGAGGFANRLKAYQSLHGCDLRDAPFRIVPNAVDIFGGGDDARLIAACRELAEKGQPVGLIILDTLNRVTPGADENTARDMGIIISKAKSIAEATGAFVLVIHHSGKDPTRGARGHSSLLAAVDTELEVKRGALGIGTLKVTKQRDGDDDAEFAFELKRVSLGFDEELEEIVSRVAVPAELSAARSRATPTGKWQIAAFEELRALEKTRQGADVGMPFRVRLSDLMDQIEKREREFGGLPKRWKESCKRAILELVANGLLCREGEYVWRTQ